MANVLIASLGESPIVVAAMYDLLTAKEKQREIGEIGKVVILRPQGGMVPFSYDLIEEALKGKCELKDIELPFEDANSEKNSFIFLHKLYRLLSAHQENGDTVYLSLAGGRKNMSALMAWIVPFFSCIKKLYHVISKDEDDFLPIEALYSDLSESERRDAMHPELEQLILVDIPFGKEQQMSDEVRSRLLATTDEDLDELEDEEAEAVEFVQVIAQPSGTGQMLEVMVTAHAENQYRKMCRNDITRAQGFELCFEHMRFPSILRNRSHDVYSRRLQKGEQDTYSQKYKLGALTFHFYKRGGAVERPVFHTVPKDIKNCANDEVEVVIVSELEIEENDTYRELEEILDPRKYPWMYPLEPSSSVTTLPSVRSRSSTESVLIVPLGESPMVATQLYTLLTHKGRTIREVILVYPERAREVRNGAELVKKALSSEGGIVCSHVRVPGLKDINSSEACEKYEKKLEETIDKIRQEHPECQIELALSGGRKAMAALTMFVALRKGIRYLYHTLINDDELSRTVERETTVQALDELTVDKKVRNDRLFLRAYEKQREKFVLFKVPVLPAGGS